MNVVTSPGVFAEWQPRYAERGIATFPVREKRPAVSGYLKMGVSASQQLAIKFSNDNSFGLACRRNRISVLDIDAPDERLLADALSEFGPSPFIVRSGSGNWQAWYRHNGETRRIRPDPSRPIDILGDGFVVAPPSEVVRGRYSIVEGSLDDLDRLPPMRRPRVPQHDPASTSQRIESGKRNQGLWRACMKAARECPDVSELMRRAIEMNGAMFYEPLPDEEVLRIVASAWSYELSGSNKLGRAGRVEFDAEEVDDLVSSDPDAFLLLTVLRRHHARGERFLIANAMHERMGWRRQRLTAVRSRLEQRGLVREVSPYTPKSPAVYEFRVSKNGQ